MNVVHAAIAIAVLLVLVLLAFWLWPDNVDGPDGDKRGLVIQKHVASGSTIGTLRREKE